MHPSGPELPAALADHLHVVATAAPFPIAAQPAQPRTVWALRLSGFVPLPALLLVHPSFGHGAFLAVIAMTAAFVPAERTLEKRFFRAIAPAAPQLHLVPPILHERDRP